MKKILLTFASIIAAASLAFAAHECCDKAKAEGKTCLKCNPEAAKTCCEKAQVKGVACTHPCCAAAAKDGKVCEKCNPPAEKPAEVAPAAPAAPAGQ
ncbi:MAG: hypothetical protein U1F77_12270 [Kiritimatiellia bacterium]